MGLINLLTDPKNFKFYNGGQGYTGDGKTPNLKNLPYGNDRIYNGNSKQPYITYSINNGSAQIRLSGTPFPNISNLGPNLSTTLPNGLTNLDNWNNDFILRGGTRAVTDSAIDVIRLTKWFTSSTSPNGLFFIGKQQLLSRTAVRTQTSGKLVNEGIYNPLNTLLQAGVNFFGTHLNKQGINPFAETGAYSNNNNLYGVKVNSTKPIAENRLFQLYKSNIQYLDTNNFGKTLKNSDPVLRSYVGGPGSFLGIGKTNIRFADQRTGINNPLAVTNPNYFFTGTVRSVNNINNNQISQGGILINTKKSWITTGKYKIYDILKSKYVNYTSSLPIFDVNTLQETGTVLQVKGPASWTPNQSDPYSSLIYTKTLFFNTAISENKGVTGQYYRLTNVFPVTNINPLGTFTDKSNHSVYDPVINGNTWPDNTSLINEQRTYVYNQQDIIDTPINSGKLSFSPTIQDFRKVLRNKTIPQGIGSTTISGSIQAGQLALAPDYTEKNLEKRVNIGYKDGSGPGGRSGKDYSDYAKGVRYTSDNTKSVGPLDRINHLEQYFATEVASSSKEPINDLVKFRIAIISNALPTFKRFIHFRAFLDTISDAYTADWNPVKYLGRGENFYTYNGYTRQISLGWTVAAQSKEELIPMYKKLNTLASSLTPYYNSFTGYMAGNMVQLTIGGYLYETPGIITSLTYNLEENSTWEIGINANGGEDTNVKELPHIIKVTGFNFIPIQRFRPELQYETNERRQYISLAAGEGADQNSYGTVVSKPSTFPLPESET